MTADQKNIDVDLSQTTFLDSCGLGTLVALYKTACSRNGDSLSAQMVPADHSSKSWLR